MPDERTHDYSHKPVMLQEALAYLNLCPGKVIVDCTVGGGGHTREILRKISPGGFLIGIDKDEEVLKETRKSLLSISNSDEGYTNSDFSFFHADYVNLEEVLNMAGKGGVDGVLLDLGVSSIQLKCPERGFSFINEGPLDMRMDQSSDVTAEKILKTVSHDELEHILRKFGEERRARRIARAILERRRKFGCVKTTSELADIIKATVPFSKKKIHPATLTFQALRIVVNNELESLEKLLNRIHYFLNEGGRVVVISFHSLEDRIVKNVFREGYKQGIFKILTPKPLKASEDEIMANPRSRSAKLRASERVLI